MWRLKTVPPVAFNQERQNLIEGGLDVQCGTLSSILGIFWLLPALGGPAAQPVPQLGGRTSDNCCLPDRMGPR